MKTRAKPASAAASEMATAVASTTAVKRELPSSDAQPPRLLILHKAISDSASIMTLAHPRTRKPTRYYVCSQSGFYELRKMASDASSPSSWLLQTSSSSSHSEHSETSDRTSTHETSSHPDPSTAAPNGYVSKAADVFTATPLDPLFLLLPALEKQAPYHGERTNRHLLCMDDLCEELFESSKHFRHLMKDTPLTKLLEKRLAAVCQTVDVDERMYRLDQPKLMQLLVSKARKMSATGLPPSMEDKFVVRPLEKPAFAFALASEMSANEAQRSPSTTVAESQSTVLSTSTSTSMSTADSSQDSIATAITPPDTEAEGELAKIKQLQRLRVAFSFLVASYFSPAWETDLLARFSAADGPVNFTLLDEHLAEVTKMKEEALAARAISDYSRKRGLEDEELAVERAEKKKKVEEEEKRRKASESRGVRDLKKVNVSGMKKMSSFFQKIPAKTTT